MADQDAFNVLDAVSEGAYDRCRGGVLKIEIKIPSETVKVEGARYPTSGRPPAPGTITTAAMTTTVEIDWELLPLVNTAGYKMEEEQNAPDTLPYPPDKLTFSFS